MDKTTLYRYSASHALRPDLFDSGDLNYGTGWTRCVLDDIDKKLIDANYSFPARLSRVIGPAENCLINLRGTIALNTGACLKMVLCKPVRFQTTICIQ
jgi:hypothetical protein